MCTHLKERGYTIFRLLFVNASYMLDIICFDDTVLLSDVGNVLYIGVVSGHTLRHN